MRLCPEVTDGEGSINGESLPLEHCASMVTAFDAPLLITDYRYCCVCVNGSERLPSVIESERERHDQLRTLGSCSHNHEPFDSLIVVTTPSSPAWWRCVRHGVPQLKQQAEVLCHGLSRAHEEVDVHTASRLLSVSESTSVLTQCRAEQSVILV